MVVADIVDRFFCILDSYSIVRSDTEPEGTVFFLPDSIYAWIFDFCDAVKMLKVIV